MRSRAATRRREVMLSPRGGPGCGSRANDKVCAMTSEALLLDRYRVVNAVTPRLGGQAFLAEDAGGAMVELHVLPSSPLTEQGYAPVRQAIEQLRGVAPG